MVLDELDDILCSLEDGVRAVAWEIADEVLSLELASRKLGIKVQYPTPPARKVMNSSDDKTNPFSDEAVTQDLVKTSPGSKRERFLKLIQEGTGMWKRADSTYFYKCVGPDKDKPGTYIMQDADGYKTIKVTLVTLCSKWQHHPI